MSCVRDGLRARRCTKFSHVTPTGSVANLLADRPYYTDDNEPGMSYAKPNGSGLESQKVKNGGVGYCSSRTRGVFVNK